MKKFLVSVVALSVFIGCAKSAPPPQEPVERKPAAVQIPSPDEMMKIMKEMATPNENHARLDAIVGTFKAESKFWMDPGAAPETTKGTSKNTWILGKRYVRQDYSGKFMGQNFDGIGFVGFDNGSKEYFSTWMDSMTTSFMKSQGRFDSGKSAIEMSGEFYCPMTKSVHKPRTILTIKDKNHHSFEMYDLAPNGHEMKMMEIQYTRSK